MAAYRRQPPPLLVRCLMGGIVDGIVTPLAWTFEKFGRGNLMFRGGHKRQLLRLKKRNPFAGYQPGPQDVFIVTYAKSGTNWMMQIVTQLAWHGKAEFAHIHEMVPWPDSQLFGPMAKYGIPIEDDSVWKAAPERMRAIKSHLNFEHLPYSEQARYICVIRDPKDVFVSGTHFFKTIFGRALSKETWIQLFQSEDFPVGGSWAVNAAQSWAQRHRPNVLVLSFKSMKRDLEGTVRKVADFLNVRLSEDEFQEVVARSSFDYMKRHDSQFEMWDLVPWRKHAAMIRKGAQGGSSELLTPEQQSAMDAYFMAELKRLGSDLPYEEFADVAQAAAASAVSK